ncbi:hypothetical protein JXA40_04160 [bacterium]|nr:hypothetical protein [candidate division CSSED10-310 bacterium]
MPHPVTAPHRSSDRRVLGLILLWTLWVQARSLRIWFDWETVRFFVQPRPGRFRLLSALSGDWIDLSDYGIRVASATFRPLMTALFQLDAAIWDSNVFGYHLINLAVHLICVSLLFHLGRKWGMNRAGRAASALLFAVHPLSTQPLWILGDRAEQFVLMGGLIALIYYGRRSWVALGGLLAALMSKETAVTIPLWLAAYDLIFVPSAGSFTQSLPGRFRRLAPHGILLVVYLVYRGWALGGLGGYRSVPAVHFEFLGEIAARNLAWLLTLPHPFTGIWIAGIVLAAGLCLPGSPRPVRMGIIWSLIFLMPVHNLCNKWYLYTPTAALALAAGAGVGILAERIRRFRVFCFWPAGILACMLSLMSSAELNHQYRNAAVPGTLAEWIRLNHPNPPVGVRFRFELPRDISVSSLSGHWFDPSKFTVKARKPPSESIVWDLNATRYLSDGTPVWTRSVEAALRLAYDDITLRADLFDSSPLTGVPPGVIVIRYDPRRLFGSGR